MARKLSSFFFNLFIILIVLAGLLCCISAMSPAGSALNIVGAGLGGLYLFAAILAGISANGVKPLFSY